MSKTIQLTLTEESINKAIREVNAYASGLPEKAARLGQLVAERVAWSASSGFSSAVADDIFTGGDRPSADVSVDITEEGNLFIVIASGKDAVFIEFGAGVYYNGAPGSSPHPKGAENGFLIGQYGKGYGKRNVWALPGSTRDNPILTHGTPAAMPMYHGAEQAVAVIADLAKEVFNS